MTAIKLNHQEYQRSLKSNLVEHLWIYSSNTTTKRTHNNSIFLNRTVGEPIACIVALRDKNVNDYKVKKVFGNDVFIEGSVSPNDKDNMRFDVFYFKA